MKVFYAKRKLFRLMAAMLGIVLIMTGMLGGLTRRADANAAGSAVVLQTRAEETELTGKTSAEVVNLMGIGWNIGNWRFPAIILGFVLNYAAYFAEIYRGGIESIPVGQYEAAEVLGYTKTQTFMKIILPQVVKIILPSVTNEVITLVKDTSLAFTLAYAEVFSLAKQISASQSSFMPFLIAGVFYFAANYLVEVVMARIEKSMDYYK